ncbi:E3 ubiquitin-protein ligase ATL4 [Pyrus ussuriensis x Pyrus communis]|uniref:E3 ubiquitin-protein ligase ATL4 n=1 Tax=Pyrus ussuriensis x Pyrus communis TaxID=2448454 RepID=A0A5N5FP66_9ROSA|nr:E3 ubiquitin-protein ligase ATL4 [Pyrus ussuriensis x Pyrus communis]
MSDKVGKSAATEATCRCRRHGRRGSRAGGDEAHCWPRISTRKWLRWLRMRNRQIEATSVAVRMTMMIGGEVKREKVGRGGEEGEVGL